MPKKAKERNPWDNPEQNWRDLLRYELKMAAQARRDAQEYRKPLARAYYDGRVIPLDEMLDWRNRYDAAVLMRSYSLKNARWARKNWHKCRLHNMQ